MVPQLRRVMGLPRCLDKPVKRAGDQNFLKPVVKHVPANGAFSAQVRIRSPCRSPSRPIAIPQNPDQPPLAHSESTKADFVNGLLRLSDIGTQGRSYPVLSSVAGNVAVPSADEPSRHRLLSMPVLFSELNSGWRPVPEWANFLIRLGYGWPTTTGQRRIALVSMPCDSPAAYLVGLGSLIRDLGSPAATNVSGHYDALLRHARQYLNHCRSCESRCFPDLKGCGYAAEASGRLRDKNGKVYEISPWTDFKSKKLVVAIPNGTWQVWPQRALDLQTKGQPPARLAHPAGALAQEPYIAIVPGTEIVPANLRESYSGICVAGRRGGEAASREVCASIRFLTGNIEYALPQLLTIQGWSDAAGISRMNFFNIRTDRVDSEALSPALAVADGDASFLKVLTHPEFQNADIIGVMHRTIDRERLDAVGHKIASLRQWYDEDTETFSNCPAVPRGIGFFVYCRALT
jgi:hypothetical protein